jgi:hypothetical protein
MYILKNEDGKHMSDYDNREEKPVEIFCPICGYKSFIGKVDEKFAVMPRDEKVEYVKTLQLSGNPVFICSKCDNPEQSARIMEVR